METTEPEHDSHEEGIISSTDTPNVQQQPKPPSHQCKICGAPALHSNYGAMTCSPCKMFFKRNAALGQKQFTCNFDGQCEININNRHICPSCRLARCFSNGMRVELIRCALTRKTPASRTQHVVMESVTPTTNILTRTTEQMLPTTNLLDSVDSTLFTSQWTFLSNLIYSYDESKLLSIGQQFINLYTDSQFTEIIDPTLPKEFIIKIFEASEVYIRSNTDFYTLSSDERSAFLRNIVNNVTCLGTVLCWSLSQVHNCKPFVDAYTDIYGKESVTLINRVLKFIDSDIVIAKLALSMFAFCSNYSIWYPNRIMKTIDTLAIFRIQIVYAEITWKYLLYTYGYQQSIRRFMNLVQCLLAATDAVADGENIEKYINDIDLLVEQIELAFILDDIEHIDENKN